MKLELSLESVRYKKTQINLEDYGMTKEDWDAMSESDQENWLDENVLDGFDQPSWVIEKFKALPN